MKENCVTVLARLSYVHIFEPDSIGGQTEPKYSCACLFPKTDQDSLSKIKSAINACVEMDRAGKNVLPKAFRLSGQNQPLHDGDDKEGYQSLGVYYLNAKSSSQPSIVDEKKRPMTPLDSDRIYSGCWAYVNVSFFPYNRSGNAGVGCALNGVMKWKDDERLDARMSTDEMFGGVQGDPLAAQTSNDEDWLK